MSNRSSADAECSDVLVITYPTTPDLYSYRTMDTPERIGISSSFLLQAPPGEINDVLNGLTRSVHLITDADP